MVALFQLSGCLPVRRMTVNIAPRHVGCELCNMVSSDALAWSGPEAEDGGAKARASDTSRGETMGISGDRMGGR